MEVKVDPAVCDFVSARGGALWIRSTRRQCCGGSTTWLRTMTARPKDAGNYSPLACELPVSLFFRPAAGQPEVLHVALGGLLRRRPVALWNGCTVKI